MNILNNQQCLISIFSASSTKDLEISSKTSNRFQIASFRLINARQKSNISLMSDRRKIEDTDQESRY